MRRVLGSTLIVGLLPQFDLPIGQHGPLVHAREHALSMQCALGPNGWPIEQLAKISPIHAHDLGGEHFDRDGVTLQELVDLLSHT